ncbi:MAG TPA: zinc ribbon domain-containing protein [Clostridia bacterium]|nr:zinc ribbon domain-containing protein [Clostridia bacterium]
MANDLLGGLSGLMKGLSGFMPQDDPDVKILNAQSELNDLAAQETELYAQAGKAALKRYPGQFAETEDKLGLIQANRNEANAKLQAAKAEKEQKDRQQQLADAQFTCPSCGMRNPDGVKFCQECGSKLGVISACPSCGAKIAPGVRFCGECGARLE